MKLAWIAAATAACVLSLLYTSRVEIATGFHLVLGDWLDGRIQVAISEHWYNVLAGREHWNEMSYFAPARDSLGYNDGYLLNGLIAAVFRLFGADAFLAFDLSSVAIRATGFAAFTALARDGFGLRWPAAILGATLFTVLDNLACQEAHAQLLSVALAPLVAWLLWRGYDAQTEGRRPRSALAFCLAALVYGTWLLTAYYMAFFFTLFAALFALALLAQHLAARDLFDRRRRRAFFTSLAQRPPARWWPLAVAAVAFVLSTVPFLLVYLPKAHETRMHRFADVVAFLPSVFDLINVGPANLVGGLTNAWLPAFVRIRLEAGEHQVGFPPLILLLAVAAILSLATGRGPRLDRWRALAAALVLSTALAVHLGNHSLWKLVFLDLPGAKGVRVVCRLILFLGLPVTLLAASALDRRARSWPAWLLATLVALLLVEEVNVAPPVYLDRPGELHLLASVPPPPAACRAFYVRKPFPRPYAPGGAIGAFYPHNVDAMVLAERLALPTVNGFSTFNPPSWDFAGAERPDYIERVHRYLKRTGVKGRVCGVDLARGTWTLG